MPRGKTQKSKDFIDACKRILEEIQPASVRAVAYQLFVRGELESMAKTCTNRVSTQLVYAREEGIIPWESIVDEAREEERVWVWDDIDECVRYTQETYRRDYWLDQPVRVGVVSEKGTVRGTLDPVLERYQVPFLPTHGHNSATETHRMAVQERGDTRLWVALYVGDWDPSGMHMSEVDLPERLQRYGASDSFEIKRLAIHADDLDDMERQGLTFDARAKEEDAEEKYGPQTPPRPPLHPCACKPTFSRIHQLEQHQLLCGVELTCLTPWHLRTTDDQRLLGIARDQHTLGRGKAGGVKDPVANVGDLASAPVVAAAVFC
jgi:hypothetical protein